MIYDDARFRGELIELQRRHQPNTPPRREVRPVPIDAAFEHQALDAARTCWHCHTTFASVQQRDSHVHACRYRLAPRES
jgi:hypothetical protein